MSYTDFEHQKTPDPQFSTALAAAILPPNAWYVPKKLRAADSYKNLALRTPGHLTARK